MEKELKINSIVKWSNRAVVGLALVDIIQSSFTGQTITECLLNDINAFQAYLPNALVVGVGTYLEIDCSDREKEYTLTKKTN